MLEQLGHIHVAKPHHGHGLLSGLARVARPLSQRDSARNKVLIQGACRLQALPESLKCRALRQEHEQPVEALDEARVGRASHIQQLQPQVDEYGTLQQLDKLVNLIAGRVDERVSPCWGERRFRSGSVTHLHEESHSNVYLDKLSDERTAEGVSLGEKAEAERGYRVVAPACEQRHEHFSVLRLAPGDKASLERSPHLISKNEKHGRGIFKEQGTSERVPLQLLLTSASSADVSRIRLRVWTMDEVNSRSLLSAVFKWDCHEGRGGATSLLALTYL
jgi:hypothetical protein